MRVHKHRHSKAVLLPFALFAMAILATQTAVSQNTNADLVLSFTSTPNEVSLGGYFRGTVSVVNSSVSPATNVVVTNVLPPNATFVGASASQGTVTQASGQLSCAFGTLTYNQTVTLTFELKAS